VNKKDVNKYAFIIKRACILLNGNIKPENSPFSFDTCRNDISHQWELLKPLDNNFE